MNKSFYSQYASFLDHFILEALHEDIQDGDFSILASFSKKTEGKLVLKLKESAIIAGVDLAEKIYFEYDNSIRLSIYAEDGVLAHAGDTVFSVEGSVQSLLATERLVLNCMQRMSGIATLTHSLVQKVAHTPCKLLDTRKTTPNFRYPEKWAVLIGGGENHRMGLFDMIMLKDNHVDFCGGIEPTLNKAFKYLNDNSLQIPVIVETRSLKEVKECLSFPQLHRILLDNMSIELLQEAVALVDGKIPTEASGNITEKNLVAIAETGVNYASLGALTHSAQNIDMSLVTV